MIDEHKKAYEVQDNYEGHAVVVFATNNTTARRAGASDLGIELDCVEYCKRAPHLDQYAPGPVPPLVLIEHGWWFECGHCGRRVSNDMAEELELDGLDSANFVPRPAGDSGVFCSASCESHDHMATRGREEAEEALREVFEAKFPDAEIVMIHCYDGPKLMEPKDTRRGGSTHVVTFTFPGSKYSSQWNFGDDQCWVPRGDMEAFEAWRHRNGGAS